MLKVRFNVPLRAHPPLYHVFDAREYIGWRHHGRRQCRTGALHRIAQLHASGVTVINGCPPLAVCFA